MKNPRITKKEQGLLKGAINRVFSRSELRKQALERAAMPGHIDPNRPRVTKWSKCAECQKPEPQYLCQVDHIFPRVPIDSSFEDMTKDEFVDRTWCEVEQLQTLCKPCHKIKTKIEAKERRLIKKGKTK